MSVLLYCPFGTFGSSRFLRIFPVGPFPLSWPSTSTYKQHSRKGPRHNQDFSRRKWETPRFGIHPVYLLKKRPQKCLALFRLLPKIFQRHCSQFCTRNFQHNFKLSGKSGPTQFSTICRLFASNNLHCSSYRCPVFHVTHNRVDKDKPTTCEGRWWLMRIKCSQKGWAPKSQNLTIENLKLTFKTFVNENLKRSGNLKAESPNKLALSFQSSC